MAGSPAAIDKGVSVLSVAAVAAFFPRVALKCLPTSARVAWAQSGPLPGNSETLHLQKPRTVSRPDWSRPIGLLGCKPILLVGSFAPHLAPAVMETNTHS